MVEIGFGNVVSQVVLFMSVMVVIVVLSLTYKTYISTTNLSLRTQHETVVEKIDTSFVVNNAVYDSNVLTLTLENDGAVKLDPNNFDYLIDSERIVRDESQRVYALVEETNLENPEHFDPTEMMEVNITKNLAVGKHVVRVLSENGVVRSKIFDVV